MNVTTVSASARFSKALGDGVHKTVELSAEATVEYAEDWHQAQAALYQELGQQLKQLWTAKGNGPSSNNGTGSSANGKAASILEHHCQEHGTPFKRYEKEGRTWYAHKAGEKWCREKR